MLRWALIFAIISLITGLAGFTEVAGAAAGIAKFLFFIFIFFCAVFLALGLLVARKIT